MTSVPVTVDDVVSRILAELPPPRPISVMLLDSVGCFAAKDVVALGGNSGGGVVLAEGDLVTTRQLARLAAAGVDAIEVAPRPRVVMLTLADGTVVDSMNTRPSAPALVLASACHEAGAMVYRVATVPRDLRAFSELVEDQLVRADMLLLVRGRNDSTTPDPLDELELFNEVEFHHVGTNPGGELGFGLIGEDRIPLIVLPDDTLASYLFFELFVRPAIRALAADPKPFRDTVRARSTTDWALPHDRQEFRFGQIDVIDGETVFRPAEAGEPLVVLAESPAIASVPRTVTHVRALSRVLVIPLDGPSG